MPPKRSTTKKKDLELAPPVPDRNESEQDSDNDSPKPQPRSNRAEPPPYVPETAKPPRSSLLPFVVCIVALATAVSWSNGLLGEVPSASGSGTTLHITIPPQMEQPLPSVVVQALALAAKTSSPLHSHLVVEDGRFDSSLQALQATVGQSGGCRVYVASQADVATSKTFAMKMASETKALTAGACMFVVAVPDLKSIDKALASELKSLFEMGQLHGGTVFGCERWMFVGGISGKKEQLKETMPVRVLHMLKAI